MSKHIWTDANSKQHIISEMETSHIENCMRVIENNNYCYIMRSGGDDWYDEEEVCLRDVYENMRNELRLRAIEFTLSI